MVFLLLINTVNNLDYFSWGGIFGILKIILISKINSTSMINLFQYGLNN